MIASIMYAIIQTGGKQYRVEKGTKLQVEQLPKKVGEEIEITEILLVKGENGSSPAIGNPFVESAKVSAIILKHSRAPKVIVFKKRAKKGYKKIQGHRQNLTTIEIKEIKVQ